MRLCAIASFPVCWIFYDRRFWFSAKVYRFLRIFLSLRFLRRREEWERWIGERREIKGIYIHIYTEYRYFRICGELFPFAFRDLPPESIRREKGREATVSPGSVNTSRPNSELAHNPRHNSARFRLKFLSARENIDLSLSLSSQIYTIIRFSTSWQFIGVFRD